MVYLSRVFVCAHLVEHSKKLGLELLQVRASFLVLELRVDELTLGALPAIVGLENLDEIWTVATSIAFDGSDLISDLPFLRLEKLVRDFSSRRFLRRKALEIFGARDLLFLSGSCEWLTPRIEASEAIGLSGRFLLSLRHDLRLFF